MGSHLADELIKLNHKVVVLDDLSGGFEDNVPEGAHFVRGSVTDHKFLDKLFRDWGFDYVYHLAAYAAEGLSHFIRRFNYLNNLVGSVNLINAAVNYRCKCFVFTSSIAVYGAGQLPMTEDMTPAPEDPYGIAKYAVEMDLAVAHEIFGLDYVIFRPHNVYGARQNIGDKYRNVIGIFINQLMQGWPMTVFGDGEQTRAFSHISDIAPSIAASVELPEARNQVFNVGADKPYSVNYLAQAVANAMNVPCNTIHLLPRSEVVHAFSSHEKAQRVFGVRSAVSLEEGISNMVQWAKQVGARTSSEFGEIEIERNLPPSWAKK